MLFVGNSFTYYGDVPGKLSGLAAEAGRAAELELESVVSAGETLKGHYESGLVDQALHDGVFDIVVLQEHPTMPFDSKETFFKYATLLDAEVRGHGAQTWLYVTWVDKSQTAADQATITSAYVELAKELGATVVPVGPAFAKVRAAAPSLELFHSDGFHANENGAFLSASVFFASLFDESPEGLAAPSSVTTADCSFLEASAWETYISENWSF